ncbi:MAG: sodium:proton antiporter [Nitrososphaerota archaeon]|nr:sodium:proton antiporter [Nitrososphaerales archaeon]MDW8044499.1 sodium:proton antiporter [Nitrososphaerota archaeon]
MNAHTLLWVFLYTALALIIIISIYGIVVRPNVLKKIIALTIFGDTANTLIILVGYRSGKLHTPELDTLNPTREELIQFALSSVDPLPQCLVLTAVVINMSITALLVFLSIQLYRHRKSLDVRKIVRLRG